MWFAFAVICLMGWGCADLFYKKGTDDNNNLSHLETAVSVGLGMGLMSVILIFFGADISFINIIKYSPASLMYILSMVIGYAGLRYLEVSIISPVQNSSGALSAVVMIVWFTVTGNKNKISESFDALSIGGTIIICIGIICLSVIENKLASSDIADVKYKTGAKALIFPLLYCVFDTIGTAADGIILDENSGFQMSEIDVLATYGITFFVVGILCWLYMCLKHKKYNPLKNPSQLCASGFEVFGQVFYVYAMAENPVFSAPLIGSYCVMSIILSRVFLKEKLAFYQKIVISAVVMGIVLLGVSEGIAEI